MSLTGSIEDVALLDVLQIVSFSRKTGILEISSEAGAGAIVFRDGRIVACFGVGAPAPGLDALAPHEREAANRDSLRRALAQLIRLREGLFSFSLSEQPPQAVGSRDITLETLEDGLDPQELLLDLSRTMDEDRRDSSAALEAAFAVPETLEPPPARAEAPRGSPPTAGAAPSPPAGLGELPPPAAAIPPAVAPGLAPAASFPPPPVQEAAALLLVDDEEDVRAVLSEAFADGGYQVVEAEDPETAVKKAQRLTGAGVSFLVVCDLGMPTSGGTSFQGGFEIFKRLGRLAATPPVVMMSETLSQAVRARAKQMGVSSFVLKPSLSKLDPRQHRADLQAFAARLMSDVLPRMARTLPAPAPPAPAASSPRATAPEPRPPTAAEPEAPQDLRFLEQHLEGLDAAAGVAEISARLMRAAGELVERGILFIVKSDQLRGLAGFGPAPEGEDLNLLVREAVVPLQEPSLAADVVAGARSRVGRPGEDGWTERLLGRIGRFRSDAVALVPLLAHGDAIAVLWGDNPVTGRDLGRLDGLEQVVRRAGIAMENVLLRRRRPAGRESE